MYQPKSIYTQLALEVIIQFITEGNIKLIKKREVPFELSNKFACFVSIHKKDGSLRGCIGTIEPKTKNLFCEIIENAISASANDPRFSKVTKDELNDLELSVDVLTAPILIKDLNELNPKVYGVIVSDRTFRRGVLLPDLEGVDTINEQLRIVKRKAEIYEPDNLKLEIKKFKSVRYY